MDPQDCPARLPPETRRRLQEAARIIAIGAIRVAAKEARLRREAQSTSQIKSHKNPDHSRSVSLVDSK